MSDLMITTPTRALAIEAKHTEPPYDTVRKWLGSEGGLAPSDESNREKVLRGWLGVIEGATGTNELRGQVVDCTYQLIHRTASVCAASTKNWRAAGYQCFRDAATPPATQEYEGQLRKLKVILGSPPSLHFYLLDCPFHPTALLKNLYAKWDVGARDLTDEVIAGLLHDALFRFEPWNVTSI